MPAVTSMDMLAEGSLTTDGTEQTIIETGGEFPFTLNAWLNLSNMEAGDTITVKQYIRTKEGGNWARYAKKIYHGIQSDPALFVTTKPSMYGIKITLEENTGEHGTIDYNVFRQRGVVDRGSIVLTS